MVLASNRAKGRIIAFSGIVIVSPDALCVKFLADAGSDVFCLLMWKSLFSAMFIGAYTTFTAGGPRALCSGLFQVGRYIVLAVVINAVGVVGFTVSLVYTHPANTLLFANLNLLWTALLGFLVLRERLARRTVAALVMALACVLLIFLPDVLAGDGEVRGENELFGDLCGLVVGLCWAGNITVARLVSQRTPEARTTAAAPAAFGMGLTCLASAAVLRFDMLPETRGFRRPVWEFWCVVAAGGAIASAIFVAMLVAPTLIPGPEVALILLLDVVLGPLWVLAAYPDEVPPIWTLIGGILLIATLAAHEAVPLFLRGDASLRPGCGGEALEECGDVGQHTVVPDTS